MMRRAFISVSFAVVIALSTRLPASAEDASPLLQVRTADGRTLYHVGERIPLTLSFTGPENKRFETNMASYDRSGRMEYEEFNVTPASGWVDPLHVYFGSSGGYMGGGLTSFAPLSATNGSALISRALTRSWSRAIGSLTCRAAEVARLELRAWASLQTRFSSASFPQQKRGRERSCRRSCKNWWKLLK
jgi:hypothetical protein